MDNEWENIKNEARLLCSPEYLAANKARIIEEITRAQIKYEYTDQKRRLPWGHAKDIKQELAQKHNCSVKTIEKIVYE